MLLPPWNEMWNMLDGFFLFLAGMVIYCIFVFSFYKQVSQKLIFVFTPADTSRSKHPVLAKIWATLVYIFKYVFVVPIFLFGWFTVIAFLLILMQKGIPTDTVLLIAVSLLATIRITAYYSEELSNDVAKILPLALLAIFLVDMDTINVPEFWTKVKEIPLFFDLLLMYFIITVLLEFVLRVYDAIANRE